MIGYTVTQVTKDELTAQLKKAGYQITNNAGEVVENYLGGKWLLLHGTPGVGKTYFFECLNRTSFRPDGGIQIWNMRELCHMTYDELHGKLHSSTASEVVLDDVGSETPNSDYGRFTDFLFDILDYRTSRFARTHITTNLDGQQFKKRYNEDRILDRLKAFDSVAMDGVSMRTSRKTEVTRPIEGLSFKTVQGATLSPRVLRLLEGCGANDIINILRDDYIANGDAPDVALEKARNEFFIGPCRNAWEVHLTHYNDPDFAASIKRAAEANPNYFEDYRQLKLAKLTRLTEEILGK